MSFHFIALQLAWKSTVYIVYTCVNGWIHKMHVNVFVLHILCLQQWCKSELSNFRADGGCMLHWWLALGHTSCRLHSAGFTHYVGSPGLWTPLLLLCGQCGTVLSYIWPCLRDPGFCSRSSNWEDGGWAGASHRPDVTHRPSVVQAWYKLISVIMSGLFNSEKLL